MAGGRHHLKKAFLWSTPGDEALAEAVASAISMAGPIIFAAVMGRISLGLAAAVGAMAVVGAGRDSSAKSRLQSLGLALATAVAAAIASVLFAGEGYLADVAIVMLSGLAAIVGNYSRALAVESARFVLFLLISASVVGSTPQAAAFPLLVAAGGMWASILILLLGAMARSYRSALRKDAGPATPHPTAAQKFLRWKRLLARFAGWQYALRLVLSLSIAAGLRWQWPEHHLHWIAVTVAILTQRQLEPFPVKTTQRALGTAVGVLFASLFFDFELPEWALVIGIGVLAGARPVLKSGNYLAYSAIMTPLIVLIMDAGKPSGPAILVDRLAATFAGAALVIASNLIFHRLQNSATRGGKGDGST